MSTFPRLSLQICTLVLLTTGLAACTSPVASQARLSNPSTWLTPYKMDVVQGNFVAKEQLELLKVGMRREQVRDILGTPLISSVFHAERWDYVFTLKRQNVELREYRLVVFFKDDTLARWEGDAMPSEAEFVAQLDARRTLGKVPVLELSDEEIKTLDAKSGNPTGGRRVAGSVSAAEIAPASAAPARTYPPLEGAR